MSPLPERPRVYPDMIVDREVGEGEVIVLHPFEARWAVTNRTGVELAGRFDGTRTVDEVAGELFARYDGQVGRDALRADIEAFLAQLHGANLIENAPLPPRDAAIEKPPSMTIYVTEQCNLRCKHCAIVEGKMPETTLSDDDIRNLIDQHTTNFDNPMVAFLGGEPMLRMDCIDLLEYARSRTSRVNISTNGLLLTEERMQRLAKLDIQVQVSLDGADPEVHDFIRGKGTFEKTWAVVERLAELGMGPRLVIAATLTRAALPQVQAFVERVDRVGIGQLRFLNLNKMRAAATHWERIAPDGEEMLKVYRYLLLDLRKREKSGQMADIRAGFPGFVPDMDPSATPWCPLGKTMIVDSQGKVYNCPVFNTPEFEIGDFRQASLDEIYNSERNAKLREMILQRRYAIPECRTCAWRNFCQGGCTSYSALRSGDMYVNDEYCDFRRDLYREHVSRELAKRRGELPAHEEAAQACCPDD